MADILLAAWKGVVRRFRLTLVFSLIVLVSLQTVLIQSSYAFHVPMRKFTLFENRESEMKGIVVEAYNATRGINSTDLFIIPDPSYRSMLMESNFLPIPSNKGVAYDGWKRMQDVGKSCNLPADLYPQPFPIIKMEQYGYDRIKDAPFKNLPQAPNVTVPAYVQDMPAMRESSDMKQYLRPVKLCDHVRVSGFYVLDNAHWMYSKNNCWQGPDVEIKIRGFKINLNTCKPHAEFHPYLPDPKWNLIRLVEPPHWDLPTVEEHVIAVPYYSLYFDSSLLESMVNFGWDFWGVITHNFNLILKDFELIKRTPVDQTKIDSANANWFIAAPPKPPECSYPNQTGCELKFTEKIITNTSYVQRSNHTEPNGILVKVTGKAGPDSDYNAVGTDTYLLKNPSIFRAQYRVYWAANEECVKFDTSSPKVVPHDILPDNQNKINGFKVVAGDVVLDMAPIANDGDEAIANQTMQKLVNFIQRYDLNTHCFVRQKGHSSTANPFPTGQSVPYNPQHAVGYFLKDGVAPAINSNDHIIIDPRGSAFTNTCEDINSTNYHIEERGDGTHKRWYVTGDFNLNYNYEFVTYQEAAKFLQAIMKYQFTKICPVGGLMKGTFAPPYIPPRPFDH